MFKYLLVPATGLASDLPVFRAALILARQSAGHLVFLHVRLDVQRLVLPIAASEYDGITMIGGLAASLEQEEAARQDRAKRAVREFCIGEGIAFSSAVSAGGLTAEWHVETGEEPHWLASFGRTADLLVIGRTREQGSVPMEVLDGALMHTGRPLLLVPPRLPVRIGQVVAIAWKDTPEASSAVAAAMPLLAGASRVVILSVTEDARTDPASCERLRQELVWHNLATTVQHVAPEGREPADALLHTAAAIGADLLVMGGYGHSRMRELVFGGFTRHVLQVADLPVLMAH